jgi:Cdc6-like AAA superfamily ATPase
MHTVYAQGMRSVNRRLPPAIVLPQLQRYSSVVETSPRYMKRKRLIIKDNEHFVDSPEDLKSDLVQFATFAAAGEANAARVFGMRRVRELMKKDPALAHALRNALMSSPRDPQQDTARTALRRAEPAWESAPSDLDSGADLLRIEKAPALSVPALYSPNVENALRSVTVEHQAPDSLRKLGLAPTKTLLFCGPPGVGKTLAATWLAREMKKPLLVLDLGTVMSRYLGATGANLRRAMTYALRTDGVLFLDELDALAKRRDDTTDVGELKRLVTVLLQQLDEWPAGRLLIAATNHPQLLDDAVWRRFEARIDFPRPNADELRTLMDMLTPSGVDVPPVWKATLPIILAQTSQSEFVRAFAQLRKAGLLEPATSPADALMRIIKDRLRAIPRKDAKAIALALADEGSFSLRQISDLTHVSRDTMRRAGVQGG